MVRFRLSRTSLIKCSIVYTRLKSNGSQPLDINWRRCAAVSGGARSARGGSGEAGRKGGRGDANRVRRVLVKLEALLVWRGALSNGGDCSSETASASGVSRG